MGRIVDYNLTEELEHGIFVSCLVRDLARELNLDEPVVYRLTLAGLLHDIGKLRLANYLYGTEKIVSPLVVEEMKYVRMHSMLSYDILVEPRYDPLILESVRYHHENFDGSGYPANLKGDEIPLGARIIRVCDVRFEADEAVRLMIDEIRHFDLKIFLAFDRVVHRVGTKYRVHISAGDEEIIRLFGDAALEGGPEDETCGKDPDEEERVLHESDTAPFII